jgi:hypothetical protein
VKPLRTDNYTKPPQLVRNEFGVGWTILPNFTGKNKTFWFFAYEGYCNMSGVTQGFTRLPCEMEISAGW